ncbi:hypothetical protein NliqN6_5326 [Naganishia liquefaciens]|uniref:DUF6534 domain-containing protein n=1 Tax=Naganishia liquefaciens TaxID=104408 RepID=A0A8H3TZ98_9TREE|nr:hypothetical protein NliqN6_5326 [Naganishia liquefaciens]
MQVGSYVSALSPQKGGRIEKGLVLGLVALNIASSALTVAWVYHLFVTRYGTWAQFLDIKTLFWFYIINGLGTALVQLFFVKRVFELTRRHPRRTSPLIAILLIMIAASFACAVVIKVRGDSLGALASAEDRILLITGTVWSSCLMACDLSITGTILAILVKKKTGWKTTDKIVSRLIWFTMQSQLPPTVFAVCFLCEYQLITPTKPYVAVPL